MPMTGIEPGNLMVEQYIPQLSLYVYLYFGLGEGPENGVVNNFLKNKVNTGENGRSPPRIQECLIVYCPGPGTISIFQGTRSSQEGSQWELWGLVWNSNKTVMW